jgi:hypothetical protein
MNLEEQKKNLEEKYNLNLNVQTKNGGTTYWELRDFFIKEIEEDNILICKDYATMCCHRTDVKAMREEFEEKLNEFTGGESDEVCTDPDIEWALGERCQYDINNLENNEDQLNQEELPPSYN